MHPLQTGKWAEFRRKTGINVVENADFVLTIHNIPHTKYTIGYLPKGNLPDQKLIDQLKKVAKENNSIFIQLEPNIEKNESAIRKIKTLSLVDSAHPLFTNYTFILDITKSEEELLKNMSQKTRYNIRLAEKKGVRIVEDDSDKAFDEYLKVLRETTSRQKFFAHTENYHKVMWETLKAYKNNNELSAHLFTAVYNDETLATWILFVFGDTLYYPYGGSSSQHREVMASNLMMWEVIKFGKKLGLKKFDMWGSLGDNPNTNDPWYGFHKFKQGYGGRLVEFVGSYDLVINPILYNIYKIVDKIRWLTLR